MTLSDKGREIKIKKRDIKGKFDFKIKDAGLPNVNQCCDCIIGERSKEDCDCGCHIFSLSFAKQEAPTKQGWDKMVKASEKLRNTNFSKEPLVITGEGTCYTAGEYIKGEIYMSLRTHRELLRSKDQEADRRVEEAVKMLKNGFWKTLSKRTYSNEDGERVDVSNCLIFKKGESWETIWNEVIETLKNTKKQI